MGRVAWAVIASIVYLVPSLFLIAADRADLVLYGFLVWLPLMLALTVMENSSEGW